MRTREVLEAKALECGIPDYMVGGVVAYVLDRRPPGDFLYAVLSNNLGDAFMRADDNNTAAMQGWVQFLWNHVPSLCWGSVERIDAWLDPDNLNDPRR